MDNKIILPELTNLISTSVGVSKIISENFIKELISILTECLTAGESIKIKGLGTFKLIEVQARKSVNVNTGEEMLIPAHNKVKFTVDKHLAEVINSPFSMFVPEDLSEGITEESFKDVEVPDDTPAEYINQIQHPIPDEPIRQIDEISEDSEKQKLEIEGDEIPNDAHVVNVDNNPVTEVVSQIVDESVENIIDESVNETEYLTESQPEIQPICTSAPKNRFWKGFLTGGASVAVLIMIATISYIYLNKTIPQHENTSLVTEDKSVNSENTIAVKENPIDSIEYISETAVDIQENSKAAESVATLPSDEKIVYDVISKTRFLTTMAKEHYGDYNLWSYIYEENKNILGHPDRIKPGTKVVIPPASKYGINASDKECVARAKRKGAEIYARYNK